MAIGPVGGMIFANQNMHLQAMKQLDFQARLDAQNSAAATATNEKSKEIEAVRPTEETHKIDPEKEHEQGKKDREAGADESQIFRKKEEKEKEEKPTTTHLLDITI
ncbi:MAG: hypothetical protein GX780_05290 [Campylobacteraceae bacterium]|nr:hypothetical protein [Campylobacteraceae bacterium]